MLENRILNLKNISIFTLDENNKKSIILNGFTLDLKAGDKIGLIGEEGSGISQLLSVINKSKTSKFDFVGEINLDNKISIANIDFNFNCLTIEKSPWSLIKILTHNHLEKEQIRKRFIELTKEWNLEEKIMRKKFSALSIKNRRHAYYAAICSLNYDLILISNINDQKDEYYLDLISKNCKKGTIIFSSSNLSTVKFSDISYVFYSGEVLEFGKPEELLYNSRHPYVWSLITSLPKLGSFKTDVSYGYTPNFVTEIDADVYSSRNKYALKIDFQKKPPWTQLSRTHFVKTWLENEEAKGEVTPPSEILQRWIHFKRNYED